MQKQTAKLLVVAAVAATALTLANYVAHSDDARQLAAQFGYGGVAIVAFICGINLLVPVPVATFIPIFLASGLAPIGIIASLVAGTTVADLAAYTLAWYGGRNTNVGKLRFLKRLDDLSKRNPVLSLVFLFLWVSFVPLPNELVLMPLGVLGFRLRSIFLPYFLGNVIQQTWVTLGLEWVIPFL